MLRIGFIGGGKVGSTLGKYFFKHGLYLSGYYCDPLHQTSALNAAQQTSSKIFNSLESLCDKSDIVFFTLPDGCIKETFEKIPEKYQKDRIFIHCSGALSSKDCFKEASYAYSFHPMCAVSDPINSYKYLNKVTFTLEGHEEKFCFLKDLFESVSLKVVKLSDENKVKYHLASVMASNLVTALFEKASELLVQCGFTQDEARTSVSSLVVGNADNIVRDGTVKALTGPVQRADSLTVKKHLEVLNNDKQNDNLELYLILSRTLLKLAQKKNSKADFSEINTLLKVQEEK